MPAEPPYKSHGKENEMAKKFYEEYGHFAYSVVYWEDTEDGPTRNTVEVLADNLVQLEEWFTENYPACSVLSVTNLSEDDRFSMIKS